MSDLRYTQYRPLILKTLKRYYPFVKTFYTRDDLFCAGMEALWRSTIGWQPTMGYTFGQYASAAIRNSMRLLLQDCERRRKLGAMIVVDDEGESPFERLETADADLLLTESVAHVSLANRERCQAVRNAVRGLPLRERMVVTGRYYNDQTLEQTGKELCITRERVRQIESKALQKLRVALKGEMAA